MSEFKRWQTAVFIKFIRFLRVTNNQVVLVMLNFSDSRLDLDFSRTKEIKVRELYLLFSSADRSGTVKSPRGLEIAPFEAFIAEVRSQQEPGMEIGK